MMDNGRSAYARERQITLLETLDRLLNRGVVVAGDVTLSVADVDLIDLDLRLLLCSALLGSYRPVERGDGPRAGAGNSSNTSPGMPKDQERSPDALSAPEESLSELEGGLERITQALPRRINADSEKVERGLAKLVLTLVELLRRLLEKQALRRIEAGTVRPEEIDRMGVTFLRLEEKMAELRTHFGLSEEDLNLSLGPLGDLL